jgi:carboxyl-terminal processing protease
MKCSYRPPSNATAWRGRSVAAVVLAIGCGSSWNGSVGAVLGKDNGDGRVFVREVPSDMAAAKAGVQEGDEVVAVDGALVRTMSPDDVHKALAGRVGTRVRLTVRRAGETMELVVERGPLRGQ